MCGSLTGKSTLLDLLALRGGDARPLPGAAATTTFYPPPSDDLEQQQHRQHQVQMQMQLPTASVAEAAQGQPQGAAAYPDAYHPPSEPGCIGEVGAAQVLAYVRT